MCLIGAMVCLLAAPRVQLSVSKGNGWPHNALRHHWLMPISCHFRYCKALLVTSLITGSALALHCCKAHKINTKIENSTPCKIVIHEDFNLKLGTRDYVADATHHATLESNRPSGGFPPKRGNITPV